MRKILLCDDDEDIPSLIEIIVGTMGYEFHHESEVNDVVTMVNSIQPDLILMDLWIPSIGGEKAVEILKSDESTKELKILLFSANDQLEKIAASSGANGFISKPFDVNNFKKIVSSYL